MLQGVVSFGIWILYGVFLSRRSLQLRQRVQRMSRTVRGIRGGMTMIGALVILLGGFTGISLAGWMTPKGFTPLGWLAATLFGLAFVHAQTMSMAMLVSLAVPDVTSPAPGASVPNETARTEDHENVPPRP